MAPARDVQLEKKTPHARSRMPSTLSPSPDFDEDYHANPPRKISRAVALVDTSFFSKPLASWRGGEIR
jgi:hypothetical protein